MAQIINLLPDPRKRELSRTPEDISKEYSDEMWMLVPKLLNEITDDMKFFAMPSCYCLYFGYSSYKVGLIKIYWFPISVVDRVMKFNRSQKYSEFSAFMRVDGSFQNSYNVSWRKDNLFVGSLYKTKLTTNGVWTPIYYE